MRRPVRTAPCASLMALLVALAGLVGPGPVLLGVPGVPAAHAAPKPSARQLQRARKAFERGRELYNQGRFADALTAFLEAHKLHPSPRLLFNAAQAAIKANLLTAARDYLQKFLAFVDRTRDAADVAKAKALLEELQKRLPAVLVVHSTPPGARVFIDTLRIGAVGTTPFRSEVAQGKHFVIVELDGHAAERRELQAVPGEEVRINIQLRKNVGALAVRSNVAGASVRVDGRLVGTTPLRGLALVEGLHAVEVSAPGRRSFTASVRVGVGETAELDATLEVASTTTDSAPRRSLRPYAWASLALGVALIAGGGGLAAVANQRASALETGGGEFTNEQAQLESTGRSAARGAAALITVGGAALVTGAVLFFVRPRVAAPPTETGPKQASQGAWLSRWRVGPLAGRHEAGVAAGVSF